MIVEDELQGSCGDVPKTQSDKIPWYCNEILKRTEGSGAITTVEFSHEGSHFAYGNASGIVSVVEICLAEESESTHTRHACSRPYQSFISHEAEFDVLKSQSIDERITIIRWLPRSGPSNFLLSSNERTIKLWRLTDTPSQSTSNLNFATEHGCRRNIFIRSSADVKVPVVTANSDIPLVHVWNKKTFDRAHNYCITSLSASTDCETFYSCDALRINLWNLNVTSEVYSILDRPLETLTDQTPLITGLDCSNINPSIFAYSTNRGSIYLHDMRVRSTCDYPSLAFYSLSQSESNILTIFVSAISDIKMGHLSDRYIFTRDYLNVKVWDSHMPAHPVEIYPVQTELRNHLSILYESELLFDNFRLSVSHDDRLIMTGSYDRTVKVCDRKFANDVTGHYSLQMQNEDASPFIDPFSSTTETSLFGSSVSDLPDEPWPRRVIDDQLTNAKSGGISDAFLNCLTTADVCSDAGCRWLQVSWKPGSHVAAVSHNDAIHLLQGLTR